MLLLAVIPRTPNTEELLNSLYANAGISGFGLLITAIVQTAQHQLSLFEALFILHILFFLGTGASPMGNCSTFSRSFLIALISTPTPAGKYHWTRSRVAMGVLVQFASVLAFTGWGLYLWVNVDTYGSHPGCNDQFKYVFFFFTVRATARWLRGLWIAGLALSATGLMISFGVNAKILFLMKRVEEEERAEQESVSIAHRVTSTPPHAEETPEKPYYFYVSILSLLYVLPPPAPLFPLIGHSRITARSALYATVMLELTVSSRVYCILDSTLH
jgi:hypothetical protein